ncbi:16S rRNA (guanine(966)-N(2))-methyltransferase RsmD [Virgibacillus salarius]|uniref:16S rRNA (guanine(966)-N(2))-methyltransferase RsmD n=1 Tax=Virgibacillus salarius TaxID=447199 RepID=UPI0031E4FB39
MIGPFFQGGNALDLFAGSGSLGFEALSRGVEKVVFVDKHPKAVHTINENSKQLKLENRVEIFRADAFRAIHAAAKRELDFQLVLLDPPYGKVNYEELINEMIQLRLIKQGAWIYCEHDMSEKLPSDHPYLNVVKQTHYGGTIGITIYKMNEEGSAYLD